MFHELGPDTSPVFVGKGCWLSLRFTCFHSHGSPGVQKIANAIIPPEPPTREEGRHTGRSPQWSPGAMSVSRLSCLQWDSCLAHPPTPVVRSLCANRRYCTATDASLQDSHHSAHFSTYSGKEEVFFLCMLSRRMCNFSYVRCMFRRSALVSAHVCFCPTSSGQIPALLLWAWGVGSACVLRT